MKTTEKNAPHARCTFLSQSQTPSQTLDCSAPTICPNTISTQFRPPSTWFVFLHNLLILTSKISSKNLSKRPQNSNPSPYPCDGKSANGKKIRNNHGVFLLNGLIPSSSWSCWRFGRRCTKTKSEGVDGKWKGWLFFSLVFVHGEPPPSSHCFCKAFFRPSVAFDLKTPTIVVSKAKLVPYEYLNTPKSSKLNITTHESCDSGKQKGRPPYIILCRKPSPSVDLSISRNSIQGLVFLDNCPNPYMTTNNIIIKDNIYKTKKPEIYLMGLNSLYWYLLVYCHGLFLLACLLLTRIVKLPSTLDLTWCVLVCRCAWFFFEFYQENCFVNADQGKPPPKKINMTPKSNKPVFWFIGYLVMALVVKTTNLKIDSCVLLVSEHFVVEKYMHFCINCLLLRNPHNIPQISASSSSFGNDKALSFYTKGDPLFLFTVEKANSNTCIVTSCYGTGILLCVKYLNPSIQNYKLKYFPHCIMVTRSMLEKLNHVTLIYSILPRYSLYIVSPKGTSLFCHSSILFVPIIWDHMPNLHQTYQLLINVHAWCVPLMLNDLKNDTYQLANVLESMMNSYNTWITVAMKLRIPINHLISNCVYLKLRNCHLDQIVYSITYIWSVYLTHRLSPELLILLWILALLLCLMYLFNLCYGWLCGTLLFSFDVWKTSCLELPGYSPTHLCNSWVIGSAFNLTFALWLYDLLADHVFLFSPLYFASCVTSALVFFHKLSMLPTFPHLVRCFYCCWCFRLCLNSCTCIWGDDPPYNIIPNVGYGLFFFPL